jgi:hypothetical protein
VGCENGAACPSFGYVPLSNDQVDDYQAAHVCAPPAPPVFCPVSRMVWTLVPACDVTTNTCQLVQRTNPNNPRHVGAGESCNATVHPAVLCNDGLTCVTDASLMGAWGTCQDPNAPTYAGEGENCNFTVHPAVVCSDGLTCVANSGLMGAWGTCQLQDPGSN